MILPTLSIEGSARCLAFRFLLGELLADQFAEPFAAELAGVGEDLAGVAVHQEDERD